jgi:hypothetical protein
MFRERWKWGMRWRRGRRLFYGDDDGKNYGDGRRRLRKKERWRSMNVYCSVQFIQPTKKDLRFL